jgi:hypothetical protein
VNPERNSHDALWQLTDRCGALLSAVDDMLANWKPGEGLPMPISCRRIVSRRQRPSDRTPNLAGVVRGK